MAGGGGLRLVPMAVAVLSLVVTSPCQPSPPLSAHGRECMTPLSEPHVPFPLAVKFLSGSALTQGSAFMRGKQISAAINTHPNVTATIVAYPKGCGPYCKGKDKTKFTHVVSVKKPCVCLKGRDSGAIRIHDVVDFFDFEHREKGPGPWDTVIVNTRAMAAAYRKKRFRTAVIGHQHNNFCNATNTEPAVARTDPLVLFLGKMKANPIMAELQAWLRAKTPFTGARVEGLQISGATLREGFQAFSQADIGVVWDQCTTRFVRSECLAYKPSTRVVAIMSTGIPVVAHGDYAAHKEFGEQYLVPGVTSEHLYPRNLPQLSEGIAHLLRHPEYRTALGQRSREIAKAYSLNEIAATYIRLMMKLTKARQKRHG